jgi:hypothetical protein
MQRPTVTDPAAEYFVPNWPATPPGRHWREVRSSAMCALTGSAVNRISAGEAKVYTLA